ncbi:helix-turn-helix transcriptional regulator [Pantoea agglomerans]|uniref:helix-turn-helix transcriptional regulator n=1 Tax=Enterobacter agglomerans TaxID=549 RepID=UPI0013BA34E0|nr:LuxR C-terminal-related transcriptional regulator [Pantoea agglomerans]NEG59842.1 hypothetical protein [Pantoea agglomerans]NEG98811.1 hypothetical protein [Pantoea agglomerans]NEH05205.1 hypothetical protein [Pantoea agglomerans]NEH16194.1 hypothetical protein [Pantoea agglomerans]
MINKNILKEIENPVVKIWSIYDRINNLSYENNTEVHTKRVLFIFDDHYTAMGVRNLVAMLGPVHLRAHKWDDAKMMIDNNFLPDIIIWAVLSDENRSSVYQHAFTLLKKLKYVQQIIIDDSVPQMFTGANGFINRVTFLCFGAPVSDFRKILSHVFSLRETKENFCLFKRLTKRQFYILSRLASGSSKKNLAQELTVTTKTIEAHYYQIKLVLDIRKKLHEAWVLRTLSILLKTNPAFLNTF